MQWIAVAERKWEKKGEQGNAIVFEVPNPRILLEVLESAAKFVTSVLVCDLIQTPL